jgi:hypothetical protein
MKILGNKYKNLNSVNKDIDLKITLNNQEHEFNEFNLNTTIDSSEVFNIERQSTPIYRIHGRIEFLSLLNGLKNNYLKLEDYFLPQKNNSKNIFESLKFYIVKPSTKFTQIPNTNYWRRSFTVIAEPKHINLFNAGYSKNVFNEQLYSFILNTDIDLTESYDYFNFPTDEIYLFIQYFNKPNTTPIENLTCSFWNNRYVERTTSNNKHIFNIGDILQTENNIDICDIIEYDINNYTQTKIKNQTFFIKTPYFDNNVEKQLVWKYNPLIPIKLRYLSSYKYEVDLNNPQYDLTNNIPKHATKIRNDDDVYVWRNILPENTLDALTGDGNNLPFVNNRRYYFKSTVLNIKPDLTDDNTKNVFKEINFTLNQQVQSITPNNNINDFGKPCK